MPVKPSPFILSNTSLVILTGGSSGIGEELIRHFLRLEPELTVCNLSRTRPEAFFEEHRVCHVPCDLSEPESVPRVLPEIRKILSERVRAGAVLLVNNSGFGTYGYFADQKTDSQTSMLAVNCVAPVALTRELLPILIERGGAVVNIASTASFQPTPYMTTYGATKAFLLHWSLGLNEELRGRGIPVLAVCPGPTSTAFFKRAGFAEPPGAVQGHTVEHVAAVTLRALRKGKALVVVGWSNRIGAFCGGRMPRVMATRFTGMLLRRLRLERWLRDSGRGKLG